jgi:hypothetical protein
VSCEVSVVDVVGCSYIRITIVELRLYVVTFQSRIEIAIPPFKKSGLLLKDVASMGFNYFETEHRIAQL